MIQDIPLDDFDAMMMDLELFVETHPKFTNPEKLDTLIVKHKRGFNLSWRDVSYVNRIYEKWQVADYCRVIREDRP